MSKAVPLDWALRRDRMVTGAVLALVVVLSWGYLLLGGGTGMDMAAMPGAMAMPAVWSPGHAALVLIMWVLMMLAMMLPSAAPMILLHATVLRRRNPEHGMAVRRGTLIFTLGYVAVWSGFAAAAMAAQWVLERASLLSPAMAASNALLAGALFLAAGVYQFTPMKQACLRHCRSPLDFLARHWRGGNGGIFIMGLHHGAYCVGCCWVVMALLFVGGVMNPVWIAALAAFVLAEKLLPVGPAAGRILGAGLTAWGLIALATAFA